MCSGSSSTGELRQEIWHRYGSISGVGLTYYRIRDKWLASGREFDVPARLWKETLRDTFDDICLYREAAKVKVRKAVAKRTESEAERKRLFTLLKYDRWTENSYLRRMMRKYCKHGKTNVSNQIVLDTQCYTAFFRNGQAWIKVMGLERGKRIAIPLSTNRLPSGTLRLILRHGGARSNRRLRLIIINQYDFRIVPHIFLRIVGYPSQCSLRVSDYQSSDGRNEPINFIKRFLTWTGVTVERPREGSDPHFTLTWIKCGPFSTKLRRIVSASFSALNTLTLD